MGGSARVSIVAQERREVREREGFHRGAGAPSVKVSTHERVLRHQGRPSASSQRQRSIAAVAAATPQERAAAAVPALRRGADNEQWCCCQLAATAATRLRAPILQALLAFHVQYRRFVAARTMSNGAVAS